MTVHFRLARPVTDIDRTTAMYRSALGLTQLGHFNDHEGFDGIMLGMPDGEFHFEFTYCRSHPVKPTPTPEDLLVFYIPNRREWESRCASVIAAGFIEVKSLNPYWAQNGRTFQDHDGYRLVIQCAEWQNTPEA
jgi:catechol 2,3-dioxygenase-like lactoylglutathione lyase family enzyme